MAISHGYVAVSHVICHAMLHGTHLAISHGLWDYAIRHVIGHPMRLMRHVWSSLIADQAQLLKDEALAGFVTSLTFQSFMP